MDKKINKIIDRESIIDAITSKKELQSIDREYVKTLLTNYPKQVTSPKELKIIVKEIRAKLRRTYGVYRKKGPLSLKTHASTRERLPYYKRLYKEIFIITGQPKSIIDLGCGLNPLSATIIDEPKPKYYAYDINKVEIAHINQYFKENRINGKAEILDIRKVELLPKADLAFLFKITDLIEKKGHKETERILTNLKVKHAIISFPTKTLSGKKMNFPRRRWVELLAERKKWEWQKIELPNEIFYILLMH